LNKIEVKQIIDKDKIVFRPNTSKTYYTGKVIKTNTCGNAVILGLLAHEEPNPPKHKLYRFLVEFDDGFLAIVCMSNIQKNKIYNPFFPSLHNGSYLGIGDAKTTELIDGIHQDSQEYSTWRGMLERCYSPHQSTLYPSYAGVTVSDRWKCFQYFWDDIKHLPGYNEWKLYRGDYHLDKDLLSDDIKIYSKDTCHFIPAYINRSESAKRSSLTGLMYTFIRIADNYTYVTDSQADFAYKTGISCSAINLLVKGCVPHIRGWKVVVDDMVTPELLSDKNITKLENIYLTHYIATRLCDNYMEEFTVQREFANKWGLDYKKISACIKGHIKTHKGWRFKIKQEEEIE